MRKERLTTTVQLFLIIILGFIVYTNSINGKFVWDDYGLVTDNVYIRSWANLSKVFTESFGAGRGGVSNFYRPLQITIHMIDYSLFGLNPIGYHLTNILLHILAALAVYWFTYTLFYGKAIAFVTSLLFVAHPVHTESVSYISGSSDMLSLLFILLSLTLYIKSFIADNKKLYILSPFFFILALLSKENALVLPGLVLAFHCIFRKPIEIKKFLTLLSVLLGYILFRFIISNNFISPPVSSGLILKRIPGFFIAINGYLRLLLFPWGLHLDYGNSLFNSSDPRAALGLSVLFSLILFAFFKRKTKPLLSFSIIWFLVTLIPVSNIYPISQFFMMEHWLYAPSLGFFLILASLVCYPVKNKNIALLLKVSLVVILAAYSFLTIQQNKYWRDPVTLYKRAIRYNPQSWLFYNELGIEYMNSGDYGEAVSCYRKSLQINPKLINTYNNLADVYKISGKNADAIAVYRKIIEIAPFDYNACLNLGLLYDKSGERKEAQAFYGKAREIIAGFVNHYFEEGNKYRQDGDNGRAVISYKKALEFDPGNFVLYQELASTYVIMGKYEEALPLFIRALKINPDSGIVHNNLAVAYYYMHQYGLAIKHADIALKLGYKVPAKFLQLIKKYKQME